MDREHYGAWRRDTEKAVDAAERVLCEPKGDDVHLQGLTRLGLESSPLGASGVLADDDRQMAEALVLER